MISAVTTTNPLPPDDPRSMKARNSERITRLRIVETGVEFDLHRDARRWLIGSGAEADFVIAADPCVSTNHCVLERREGRLVIRDRGSRNGTFVNGYPVEAAELQIGSRVLLGCTTLIAIGPSPARASAFEQLRGSDPAFRAVIADAMRAALTDCNVLVVGETGTGKELIARLLHETSPRQTGAFVAVNCGAFPRELIGSELFGHERGAFTGAATEREGYFVEANGGTLFLDELGELPLSMQPHLLRALETRRVRRIGGSTERAVDVRVVAATNRLDDLGSAQSTIRLDLYHRVATVVLTIPPLRERPGDLRILVTAMMDAMSAQLGTKTVSPIAWPTLERYDWPGNVRELQHCVSRAMTLGGAELSADDFLPRAASLAASRRNALARGTRPPEGDRLLAEPTFVDHAMDHGKLEPRNQLADETVVDCDPSAPALAPYEAMLRDAMEDALRRRGSIRGAASQLGMPKSTFADKAKQWGITLTRRR